MGIKWDDKDPNDVDYFDLTWEDRLDVGETLSSSVWAIDPVDTLVESSSSNTTLVSRIWLSGGTDGSVYELTNRVVTSAGKTLDQTVRLRVKTR